MSFFTIEDPLILDEGSEVLKKQFENHCDWCWGHGFGNCDVCKKAFGKVYRPIRIKELTTKYKTMKGGMRWQKLYQMMRWKKH